MLDSIREMLAEDRDPAPTSKELATLLERAEKALATQRKLHARLEGRRKSVLLDGTDSDLASHDESMLAAQRQIDRLSAGTERLEHKIEEALHAEAKAKLAGMVEEGREALDRYRTCLERYGVLVEEMVDLFSEMKDAEEVVRRTHGQTRVGELDTHQFRGERQHVYEAAVLPAGEPGGVWYPKNDTKLAFPVPRPQPSSPASPPLQPEPVGDRSALMVVDADGNPIGDSNDVTSRRRRVISRGLVAPKGLSINNCLIAAIYACTLGAWTSRLYGQSMRCWRRS